MCLFCAQVALEKLKPSEFWSLYKEVSLDEEHLDHLLEVIKETSIDYQLQIANERAKTR